MKQTVIIQGMTCGSCAQKVQDLFHKNYGITDIQIDPESGKVEYEHDIFLTNPDIEKMLEGTKYTLSDTQGAVEETDAPITLATYIPLFTLF
jgi:copper chaperone CopZ